MTPTQQRTLQQRTLMLVDAPNLVMRCAFGGDIPPEAAVETAVGMIARALVEARPTHLVVCFDCLGPTWRKQAAPTYKAHRTVSTVPYMLEAERVFVAAGWVCDLAETCEADDVIATRTVRAVRGGAHVVIVSGDTDALALLVHDNVRVLAPRKGGRFEWMDADAAARPYALTNIAQLPDFKALVGETGDLGPGAGVPGIGEQRAAGLLAVYFTLDAIIEAGAKADAAKWERVVWEHRAKVRAERALIALQEDAPVRALDPKLCAVAEHPTNTAAAARVPTPPAPMVAIPPTPQRSTSERPVPDGTAWFDVPPGSRAATCASCGAPIYWTRTKNDRPMPVDVQVVGGCAPRGDAALGTTGRGVSHFVTCATAIQHRREKAATTERASAAPTYAQGRPPRPGEADAEA